MVANVERVPEGRREESEGSIRLLLGFFFTRRSRHTRSDRDWSSDVCSSDLNGSIYGGLAVWAGNGEPAVDAAVGHRQVVGSGAQAREDAAGQRLAAQVDGDLIVGTGQ